MDLNRIDLFSPARVEVVLSNNKVTVDVDGRNVLRAVRCAQLRIDDQRRHPMANYFRCIKSGHDNLPESWAAILKTPEQLRKFALIKGGFADVRILTLPTEDAAEKVAAVVRATGPLCVVEVKGATVVAASARSQSAMSRDEFLQSRASVLEIIAGMIGVSVDQLSANAWAAA